MTIRRFAPTHPIEVVVARGGDTPAAFRWRGRGHRVARVEATWDVVAGWWRGEPEATRRRYCRLVTRDGLVCVAYRDLASGRWYLEQVVD